MRFDKLTRDPEPDWLERRQAVRDGLEVLARAKAEATGQSFAKAYSELLALPGIAEAAI
jgi:hypothetical protein